MRRAVQFGAGNIGRGFMAQLFYEAGYHTVFIESNRELVELLNNRKKYTLRLLDAYTRKENDLTIDNFSAVSSEDTKAVSEAVVEADIIGTAVGVKNLKAIGALLAEGVLKRKAAGGSPVDIYLCENMLEAAKMLKTSVYDYLRGCLRKNTKADEDTIIWAEKNIGFVGTSVARMVPSAGSVNLKNNPLTVAADSYHKLPCDREGMRAAFPPIKGLNPVENFKAEVERKLFTHNLGHAVLGYLGYLHGYTYVHEGFSDPSIMDKFNGCLNETSQALIKRFPNDIKKELHKEIIEDVKVRFSNPLIADTVYRVARDPIRKLSRNDRIIGSASLCLEYGIIPENTAYIAAAAFCYDYKKDDEAVKLQELIDEHGIEEALKKVSSVSPESMLGKLILTAYKKIKEAGYGREKRKS